MASTCRRRCSRSPGQRCRRLSLVQVDMADLPIEDGTASVITCVTALHLLAERDPAVAAWWRALRPGGRLVTATFRAAGTPARPDLAQGFVRRHEDFADRELVAAALEEGFRLEWHTDWTYDEETLLICVLRRR
ncbi:class I SAM-dependent methyltransferase [Nocardioides sp. W3-2-3]|uniref:class I SAM-dependent methyltransferase n=1 Tax=Nocardioides convexus TaxID=2712224 RepID=UPI0024181F42|nr:methyltransferase domain-containing protein [Nocardioides convexus]NHA00665.1 class I SAM-dependent methyltransferase [Nocardioides convexus]